MKHKIVEILKRYSIIRGGKEDGVYQVYDIKDWTNKKGLNMAKELETLLKTREKTVQVHDEEDFDKTKVVNF